MENQREIVAKAVVLMLFNAGIRRLWLEFAETLTNAKWFALISNYNIFRSTDSTLNAIALSKIHLGLFYPFSGLNDLPLEKNRFIIS